MEKTPKDPVNYSLSSDDIKTVSDGKFCEFLNTLTDVPSSEPLNPININEAGITNQQVYIQISDIAGGKDTKPVLCDIEIAVALKGHRGIHMSRCEEAIMDLSEQQHSSVDAFALAVARKVRERQGSDACIVKVSGLYLHEHVTKSTKRVSYDKIYILSQAEITQVQESVRTGIRAFNVTACPCTRTYTKFSTVPALVEAGFTLDQIKKILEIVITGSHTQRGTISVIIDKKSPEITSGELYSVIDNSTHLVYELLKRPDEHELVVRALQKPQFTEDVVRETTMNIYNRFRQVATDDVRLEVESILNDSIHIHDVRTKVTTTFGTLKEHL